MSRTYRRLNASQKRSRRRHRWTSEYETWCDPKSKHRTVDTSGIEASWRNIFVSHHAVARYRQRVKRTASEREAVHAIKMAILLGRRSDRDHGLTSELSEALQHAKLNHTGRPVIVVVDPGDRFVLLVCWNPNDLQFAVLTCFAMQDRQGDQEGSGDAMAQAG